MQWGLFTGITMDSISTKQLPLSVAKVYSLVLTSAAGYGNNAFVNGCSFLGHTANSANVKIGDADYGHNKYYICISS